MIATAKALQAQPELPTLGRQRYIAALGRRALATGRLSELFADVCREISGLLDVPLVKVLELSSEGRSLRLIAGVGWQPGLIDHATVDTGDSQAGFTLRQDAAIVTDDLRTETRFRGPALLFDHGVVSGMSVPIRTGSTVFGVLGVHATRPRAFVLEDTDFLIAVANVLGSSIARAADRETLSHTTQLFHTVFEESSDLILLVDPYTFIRAVNPAALRILGFAPEEVVGRSALEYIHVDDHAKAIEALARVIPPATATAIAEIRVRHRGGGWRLLEAVGRSTRDRSPLIVVNARDVTEQRLHHEQLLQANKLEAIGRVTASLAHDLNNVLAVIGMTTSFLDEQLEPSSALRADTTTIVATVESARKLIQRMLAFARHQPRPPSMIDLNAVLVGIEPILHKLAGPAISIVLALTSRPTKFLSDASELEQIVINLVANARDAMPAGGSISIATWRAERPRGPEIVLSVADRGSGMSAETRERIFEPFFTTKGETGGSGIGLATVYQLVTSRGGHIDLNSESVGTTFEISFPVDDD